MSQWQRHEEKSIQRVVQLALMAGLFTSMLWRLALRFFVLSQ